MLTRLVQLAAIAAGLLRSPPAALTGQIDYRNMDDDRPVLTEDAYPVERHAFELLLPYAYERERDGPSLHGFTPEIEYGVIRNGQLGIKLPVAGAQGNGNTDWGLAGLWVFELYNLNSESRMMADPVIRQMIGDTAMMGMMRDMMARMPGMPMPHDSAHH